MKFGTKTSNLRRCEVFLRGQLFASRPQDHRLWLVLTLLVICAPTSVLLGQVTKHVNLF